MSQPMNISSATGAAGLTTLATEERRLCVRAARLYYESGLTQEQIGEQLGLSRVKVNRVLRLARQAGIVEIRIAGIDEPTDEVADHLVAKLRLRDAVVVPDAPTGDGLTAELAKGASAWLAERLRPGLRVGLGLGRTISRLPETFRVDRSVDCSFTEIEGAAPAEPTGFASYNVTSRMGTIAGARTEFIYAPTFVSDRALRDRLVTEPSIARALEVARRSDVVLQSVGTATGSALLHIHGVIGVEDLEQLRAAGAVGDALGHYFDAEGRHVPFRTDDIHVGLTLEDLRRVPTSVLVAGGPEKLEAIRGALRGGYFNVVITDLSTADALIASWP